LQGFFENDHFYNFGQKMALFSTIITVKNLNNYF
jgi:hypothetical protein